MSKAKTRKPREEQPQLGGSYTRDPVTGRLTREEFTRDIREVDPAESEEETEQEASPPSPPADPQTPVAPEEKEA